MPFITQPSLSRDEAVALACKIEAINADPGFIRDIKDDALRRRLRDAGRSLGFAMETMVETIGRIGTAVSLECPLPPPQAWESN